MGDDFAKEGPGSLDNLRDQYFAGFFDGEGCVSARKSGSRARIDLSVSQKDLAPLHLFKDRFGGRIQINERSEWRLSQREQVREALNALSPFCVVKAKQLKLALDLLCLLDSFPKLPSEHQTAILHDMVDEICRLKRVWQ